MKKSIEPLRKHTLNLYDGDMEELRTLFPATEPTVLIREVIHTLVQNTRAQGGPAPDLTELKVPINV